MAPQVQSLADIMGELAPSVQGQQDLIAQQQAGLGTKYDAQRSGLEAKKGQSFNAINNQATGRGLSFSGIPLDEQATYLSTEFLPGMQNLTNQQNEENMSLSRQAADLTSQVYNQAFGRQGEQQSNLYSWNLAQQQQAFQAEQNRLDREASSRESAANRAAQNQTAAVDPYLKVQGYLDNLAYDKDGNYSGLDVNEWRNAASYANQLGVSFFGDNGFASRFWSYAGVNGNANQYTGSDNGGVAYYDRFR